MDESLENEQIASHRQMSSLSNEGHSGRATQQAADNPEFNDFFHMPDPIGPLHKEFHPMTPSLTLKQPIGERFEHKLGSAKVKKDTLLGKRRASEIISPVRVNDCSFELPEDVNREINYCHRGS